MCTSSEIVQGIRNGGSRLWAHSIGISGGQLATNYHLAPDGMHSGGSWVTRWRPKSAVIKSLGA